MLGDANHWTLPGVNAHGVGFTSLTSVDSDGNQFDATELFETDNERDFCKPTGVADTPQAILYRRFAQAAYDLPQSYPGRQYILKFAECGYEQETANAFGIKRWRVRKAVQRFCEEKGFDFGALSNGVQPTAPEDGLCNDPDCATKRSHSPHGNARTLSRAEIKRLRLTPPKNH